MTSTDSKPGQFMATQDGGLRANLELIPPLAAEFQVYGGKDTTNRAREWAIDGRYLLTAGVPHCAHGFYLMGMCPGQCYGKFRQLDHANLWVPANSDEYDRRPFLLSHPYSKELHEETTAYAEAHGLTVEVNRPEDRWYGPGTLSVRMSVGAMNWPLWPLERDAFVLLATQPVKWPDLVGEPHDQQA